MSNNNNTVKLKRGSIRSNPPIRKEIEQTLPKFKDPMLQALIALLFLTGARIKEVVGKTYTSDLYTPDDKTIKEKKKLESKNITITNLKVYLKKKNFDFDPDQYPDYVVVKLPNEKRKEGVQYKNIPYSKSDSLNKYINQHLDTLKDEDMVFPITRQKVLYEIKKIEPLWFNHLIRHSRLSELASKGASDQQLTQFAGWSDSRPSKQYVHLNWKNLVNKV